MISINDLTESNEFLNSLLDNLVSVVFVVDKHLRIQCVNDSFKTLFHKEEDRILGELCGNALGCEYTVTGQKKCGQTSNCGGCILRYSLNQAFKNKKNPVKERMSRKYYIHGREVLKHFMFTSRHVFFNGEEMVMVIVDDITELIETNLKLKKLAITDGLTQLFNHKHIYYKLEEEVNRSLRYGNSLSIIMLDIDEFKTVNDSYGHQTGDKTLAEVSKFIKNQLREIDFAGRYGGEEFLVILPQTELENACKTAERIQKAIESTQFDDVRQKVTISGGVAEFQNETVLGFIDKADKLLYKAKRNGRNRVECS
jgi:diguanylate cyclase (GGDEF)-like protein